jgi:glycosyltransferase involved in cell wall biosynthesis
MRPGNKNRLSVSVIIPTYNRGAFIDRAVRSALDQTYSPNEIIVVDDGSTDETPAILAEFAPPVRVLRQENRGRSAARNAGLRAATGDAVIFLDSDDLLLPQCIERCAQRFVDDPATGVVYTDAYLCDAQGNRLELYSQALPGDRPSGIVLGALARRNFLLVTSLVRRSCLDGIIFDEGLAFAEDYDFWRKLAARWRFQFLDEPLMCYRFHETMSVGNRPLEALGAEAQVQRRILEMPEFQDLSSIQRARAYCFHGAKLAVLGRTGAARRQFLRAIRTSTIYHGGYALLGLSLLGTRALQSAILKRRQLAGNRLGAQAAAAVLSPHHGPLCEASLISIASA